MNSLTVQVVSIAYATFFLGLGLSLTFFGYKIYRVYSFILGFLATFYLVSYIYDLMFHIPDEVSGSYNGKHIGSALAGLIGGAAVAYCYPIGWLIMGFELGFQLKLYFNYILSTDDNATLLVSFVSLSIIFTILIYKFKRTMLYISTSSLGSTFCIYASIYLKIMMSFDGTRSSDTPTSLFSDGNHVYIISKLALSLLGFVFQAFISKKINYLCLFNCLPCSFLKKVMNVC